MDTTLIQDIKDLLEKNESIAIAVGKNPTIDTLGAALGLSLSLQSIGKKTVVVTPSEPLVEVSQLVGIDKVKTNLTNLGGDLVVSFPYHTDANGEGEIQKVSYTIEDNFLNIVVKAGENGLSFADEDVRFRRDGAAPKVLIVIGTPRLSDLGEIYNPETAKEKTIVNIDNKQENQQFGNIVLVSPRLSSVSEQIADLLLSLDLPMDLDCSQNLFSGISFATDNFQKQNTSYLAFEMAGVLLRKGATRISPSADRVSEDVSRTMTEMTKQVQQPRFDNRQQQHPQRQQQQQPVQQPYFPNQQIAGQQRHDQQIKQPQRDQQQKQQKDAGKRTPPDWLTPKVYKGSTNI